MPVHDEKMDTVKGVSNEIIFLFIFVNFTFVKS